MHAERSQTATEYKLRAYELETTNNDQVVTARFRHPLTPRWNALSEWICTMLPGGVTHNSCKITQAYEVYEVHVQRHEDSPFSTELWLSSVRELIGATALVYRTENAKAEQIEVHTSHATVVSIMFAQDKACELTLQADLPLSEEVIEAIHQWVTQICISNGLIYSLTDKSLLLKLDARVEDVRPMGEWRQFMTNMLVEALAPKESPLKLHSTIVLESDT